MKFFRAMAPAVVAVLALEALMVETEKAIPIVEQWSALWFALLFVGLGFVLRRRTSTASAIFGALVAAIAYVTLGAWIAEYLRNGTMAWHWLGHAMTMAMATVYFFTLMAIGIAAASFQLRLKTP
jgi:hypothetical protein